MTREVRVGRAPPRVVGVILMVLGISVTVIGAEESDPFDLMDASTPAAPRQVGAIDLRGGAWGSTSFILRTAVRVCDIPESSWFSSGFRLAR